MKEREGRDTKAVRHRIENIKLLLAKLKDHQMPTYEIQELLGYTPSGVRKYIRELMDAGMIRIVDHIDEKSWVIDVKTGVPVFALDASEKQVKAYIERLEQLKSPGFKPPKALQKHEPGITVHVMEGEPLRKRFKIPEPDPVLAHFFGFAGT